MKLEQQVCSLDLAKRLKELGAKQESLFQWAAYETQDGKYPDDHYHVVSKTLQKYADCHDDYVSAFTVAELGEMLPPFVTTEKYLCKGKPRFNTHEEETIEEHSWHDDKEADARAKMLIYLIEQGLVKP